MVKIGDYCIRCGLCIDLHPELFAYDRDEDVIRVLDRALTPERFEEVKEMAADCAVSAIQISR